MNRGMIYHGCGEEYDVEKKEKGKQYNLPYNIEDVGKNIKWLKELIFFPAALISKGR